MASLLLDTHVALWWWREPDRLSARASQAIASNPDIWVSAVSAFEIATKWRAGKLDMIGDPSANFPPLMAANQFKCLPVNDVHALSAGLLAFAHKDPFDRLLAAQSLAEEMTFITRDPVFAEFGCKVLW